MRYMVTFTHRTDAGLEFEHSEWDTPDPIQDLSDVKVMTDMLRDKGYRKPFILAFSPFADRDGN